MIVFFYNPFPFEIMEIVLSNIVDWTTEESHPILSHVLCVLVDDAVHRRVPARKNRWSRSPVRIDDDWR